MSTLYNPQIVNNGLVLYLDASNSRSYPQTGTTWSDLSGNGNTGTLTNGPTFNSGNGGYITTDGTNDYIEVTTKNTNLEFQPNQPHSVFCWVYNLTSPNGIIIGNMNGSAPYQGWDMIKNPNQLYAQVIASYPSNALSVYVSFDYTANANKWVYIGYTYDGSSPTTTQGCLDSMTFYINGQLHTTGKTAESGIDGFNTTSETTSYPTNQRFRVGGRWDASTVIAPANLNMACALLYNRKLTTTEVSQNFNAIRNKFGV